MLTLVFTFFVALSTVGYAILTRRLTFETIKMRKAQTDPKVVIYLKQNSASNSFLDVVIENIGTGQAYDIKVTVINELQIKDNNGVMLSSLGFVKHGVSQLAPSQSIKAWYFSFLGIYEEVIDKEIELEITYRNESKERLSEKVYINLNQYEQITTIGEDPVKKISKDIDSIKKSLEKISTGSIKVETYNREDRIEQKKELEAFLQKRRERQQSELALQSGTEQSNESADTTNP